MIDLTFIWYALGGFFLGCIMTGFATGIKDGKDKVDAAIEAEVRKRMEQRWGKNE